MNNKGIILKTYDDERINKELKKCLINAVADDEFDLRYDEKYGLCDFNILLDNIDKIISYVKNGYKGELRINSNIWEVCLETLGNILDLYDLEWANKGFREITEEELVVPTKRIGNVKKKIYEKMLGYGWHLGEDKLEDFDDVYNIHYDFIEKTYDYIKEEDYDFSMQDISKSSFEDMIDFISDFIRALDEVDREMK